MCGRFVSILPALDVAGLFGAINPLPDLTPSWNVAPGQDAAVLRRDPETGERRLDLLQWGLIPHFSKQRKQAGLPVNCRAETISRSPLFQGAFGRRRCLVPATAFYAWKSGEIAGQPYAVARADGRPMALAGIWEHWRTPDGAVKYSFALVTTRANAEMTALHDRMPLIIEQVDWPGWLGETEADPVELLRPLSPGTLRFWPVSRAINAACNDGPQLLAPWAR